MFEGHRFTGCGKSRFRTGFSSTGILACAEFAALTFNAQPRMAVLLDFFRNLFSRWRAGLPVATQTL
jgi:hypothetical protein